MAVTRETFAKLFAKNGQAEVWLDVNYLAGWASIGGEPPTVEQFNGVQKLNDEKAVFLLELCDSKISTSKIVQVAGASDSAILSQKAVTDLIALSDMSVYIHEKQYGAGDLIKVDGVWYECYHPDGAKNKDPRDSKNRPEGWTVTDESQPYHWLKIGKWLSFPEVGSPIALPSTTLREGLIKYRNDGVLHKDKFWRLAQLYPSLVTGNYITIADLRGEFIRGLDDGRGVDTGRVLNSAQGHMFESHSHLLQDLWTENGAGGSGLRTGGWVADAIRYTGTNYVGGSETRPRNIAMLYGCRI